MPPRQPQTVSVVNRYHFFGSSGVCIFENPGCETQWHVRYYTVEPKTQNTRRTAISSKLLSVYALT